MKRNVEHQLKKCMICNMRKVYTGKTKESLIPRTEFGPLEQVVMDIAHFPESRTKKRYVLVMVDRFSKLVSFVALNKQDEKSVVDAIKEQWIYRFGKPKSFLTDRGKIFEGKLMRLLAEKFGIKQEFASPYQHQSNGLAERSIRTLRDMVVTTTKNGCSEGSWDRLLPRIQFVINATQQKSSGLSPFEIIFGRRIVLHGLPQDENPNHIKMKEVADRNLQEAANKLSKYESDRRTCRQFKEGEEVLVKVDPHKLKKDGFRYEGPYKIIKFLSPHQVLIDNAGQFKPRRLEWLKKITVQQIEERG